MRIPRPTPKRARIEIVPMIDAIFFLLVFFMYSSLSMIKLNGLPMALPQAPGTVSSGRPGPAKDAPHLMVQIQPDGKCTVGGNVVAPATVGSAVQTRLTSKPGQIVVLQAQKGSGVQQLVTVMDSLNSVRLKDNQRPTILIATEAVTNPDTSVSGGAPSTP